MLIKKLLRTVSVFGLALSAWASMPASANDYPTRPIYLVVPFAAGGITDISSRLLGAKLGETLSQTVVVENKAGGNAVIGTEYVAKSPPDGYRLIMGTMGSHAVNASLRKDLRFSIKDDFAPVSLVTAQPMILVINPRLGVKTLPELIALIKANPNKYTFGSAGVGTSAHMAGELFKSKAGLSMVHAPYKGSAPMLNDLLGGQIDMAFDYAPTALPHIRSGRLQGLAVTDSKRADFAPDMPTVSEVIPNFRVLAWQGIFAPANTPQPILDKLSTQIQSIMRQPEVVSRLKDLGADSVGSSREDFTRFVAAEIALWNEVIKANGIKSE